MEERMEWMSDPSMSVQGVLDGPLYRNSIDYKIAGTWTSSPDIRQSLTSIANPNREIVVHRLPPPRWTVSLSWRSSFGGIAITTRGLNCLARCISVQTFAPCVETTPRMPIISSSAALADPSCPIPNCFLIPGSRSVNSPGGRIQYLRMQCSEIAISFSLEPYMQVVG